MAILRGLRAVQKVGGIICSPTWRMLLARPIVGLPDDDIFRRMKKHAQGDIVLEEDNGIYEKGDILRSFHH